MGKDIGEIRTEYMLKTFKEEEAALHPMLQFEQWWHEAEQSQILEINAMVLSTVSKDCVPSSRVVLLKEFNESGFVFYTNYQSRKAQNMAAMPRVSLVFFWKELQRQVNIEGWAERTDASTSDAYFQSRPYNSRIGAWSSPQSKIIASRSVLEENERKYRVRYPDYVPRPEHWGGYLVKPQSIEFWQGRSSRLHDRILYQLTQDSWTISRLAP